MKPTIETTANPYHQVGSMMAIAEQSTLLASCATARPSNDDKNDKAAALPLAVGSDRQDCLAYLDQHNISSISFAHWLAIPTLQLLLVFQGQCCVAVDHHLLSP